MSIKIGGNAIAGTAEVELNSSALRVTRRPIDVGSLGAYSAGVASGTMAAGLSADSPIFSFRAGAAITLIRRLALEAWTRDTAFTAGDVTFKLWVARAFSASDTGGTALTLSTANTNKKRTSFAYSAALDIRYSATAALSAGTRTKDTNPIGIVRAVVPTTSTYYSMIAQRDLLRPGLDEAWPIVLAANEGIILEATVPATGTWAYGINIDWEEVASY